MTDCRVFVGQNGRIWIDGDRENVQVAVDAIGLIDAQTQSDNLTDRVREFIEERLPQSADGDGYEEDEYEEED
jgi:exosome complex component RRP4